jgi:hypothetical protein
MHSQIASLEAAEAKRKVELTKVAQRRREVETSAADLQAEVYLAVAPCMFYLHMS